MHWLDEATNVNALDSGSSETNDVIKDLPVCHALSGYELRMVTRYRRLIFQKQRWTFFGFCPIKSTSFLLECHEVAASPLNAA